MITKKTKEADLIIGELSAYISAEKKESLPYFFATGKGQYGEGDLFMGIVVPNIRTVAKQHRDASVDTLEFLLAAPYHEQRLCALLIMVERFKKADETVRKTIVDFYLAHTAAINNWDLVDLSCKDILGEYLVNKTDRNILYSLANSSNLWEQRIAVVSTFAFIRRGDLNDIFALAEILLHHPHDLMHKATGWMLREAGKKDRPRLSRFLDRYHTVMPRTMLRYSIEKYSPEERAYYMNKHK